jgi:hypothetical protein
MGALATFFLVAPIHTSLPECPASSDSSGILFFMGRVRVCKLEEALDHLVARKADWGSLTLGENVATSVCLVAA